MAKRRIPHPRLTRRQKEAALGLLVPRAEPGDRAKLLIFGPAGFRPEPPCRRCGAAVDEDAVLAVHCTRCHDDDMKRFEVALREARKAQLRILPGGRQRKGGTR
jgi:hypothetical protein